MDGIISINNEDDLLLISRNISPSTYWDKLKAMNENYLESIKYWNICLNMKKFIDDFIK